MNSSHEATDRTEETVPAKAPRNRKWFILGTIVVVVILLLAAMSYYQATRFNSNITINGIKVGGLTSDQALDKLKQSKIKNQVYIGNELVLDEGDSKMGISEHYRSEVEKYFKKQYAFFPSFKEKNYTLTPKKTERLKSQDMEKKLGVKIDEINKDRKAPVDAKVEWVDGKVKVTDAVDGQQYDKDALMKAYKEQVFRSEVRLDPVYLQPVREDSEVIQENKKKMEKFIGGTIEYKVQDKPYTLKADELIKKASVSTEGIFKVQESGLQDKIDAINHEQSTLNKKFAFKTHSGKLISVQGQGYGWAIDAEKEAAFLEKAFAEGKKQVEAKNIYGNGWGSEPIGYGVTSNNGIGDTYAEVSLSEQRVWIYKNGKLAVTTHVVTGKQSTNEDTHPGVWYILYKASPYTLKGSAVGNPNYEVDVNYWAPFTNDGQGFHDADWRKNWSGNAYVKDGSAGCVNTPPDIMKVVYENLSTYDPVIVY